jgi:hypothetical protein
MIRVIAADNYSFAPSILCDPVAGKFRMWHNRKTSSGHILFVHRDSTDGVTWSDGTILRDDQHEETAAWCAGVIDTGVAGPQRFWHPFYWVGPGSNGMYFAWSADGIIWTWPASFTTPVMSGVDDRIDPFINPLGGYGMFVKKHPVGGLRETWVTLSPDLVTWTTPTRAFWADAMDDGATEFYGAAGIIQRDGLLIAFLRVLRDDVRAGLGYTVLAWSKDAVNWNRSRVPFMLPRRGQFDDAHAWIFGVCEQANVVRFAYSAHDLGHKVGTRACVVTSMPSADLDVYADGYFAE